MEGKDQRTEIPDGLGFSETSEEEVIEQPEGNEPEESDDPLDQLASELDSQTRKDSEEEKFDEDLGWEDPEESEEPADDPEEEEGDEPDDPEVEEEEEGDDPDEEEDPEEEEGEDPEEEDDPEEEEPEALYDAKRDFPDEDLPPTTYKDRVSLNNGVVAKINYSRDLLEKLEKLGTDVGAIDLPSLFGDNPEFAKEAFDRSTYIDREDEIAKQDVKELDRFINDVKGKISRVETEVNSVEQENSLTREWDETVVNLGKAINVLGLKQKDTNDMTYQQLLDKSDELIEEYLEGEAGEELAAEKGIKAVNEKIDEIRAARKDIEKVPGVYERYESMKNGKQEKESTMPSPEDMTKAYEEWEKDQPNLPIHKHADKTGELKKAFMEFVKVRINSNANNAPQSPRDWHESYKAYQAEVQREKEKYESTKKESSKKAKSKSTMKASKNKRKPNPRRVRTEDSFTRHGLDIDDVDNELDDLAAELDKS